MRAISKELLSGTLPAPSPEHEIDLLRELIEFDQNTIVYVITQADVD